MQFLKEQGYGGVIIWSLDLDDKTGQVCNEGPFPLFNAAKRELLILPEHLAIKNKKCSDENTTVSVEHLHSQTTITRLSPGQILWSASFVLWIFPPFRSPLVLLPDVIRSLSSLINSFLQMNETLLELRDRASLASCAKRYDDVIRIYKDHLSLQGDIPPSARSMLYHAYQKLILDEYFKSYWKLTSAVKWDWSISKRLNVRSIIYRRRSSSWSIVTSSHRTPTPIWTSSSLCDNAQIFSSSIQPSPDPRPERSCCSQPSVPTPKVKTSWNLLLRQMEACRRELEKHGEERLLQSECFEGVK